MVLKVLVNKRFVFIRVIRGQKINAVVLAFLCRCRAVCTPLALLSNRTTFPIYFISFLLKNFYPFYLTIFARNP